MADQDAKTVNTTVCGLLKSKQKLVDWVHEGRAAWRFSLDDGSLVFVLYKVNKIIYNGKLYDMDEQTKLLVSKIIKKQQRREIRHDKREDFKGDAAAFGCVVGSFVVLIGVFVGIVYVLNEIDEARKMSKQVSAYREALPNWNDSIRLAETDGELANAINRREQAELKVQHYRDSLVHSR